MKTVQTMAAFLAAWQHHEACCWAPHPGSELDFTPLPTPTLTLRISPGSLRDSLLKQILSWRFQHPDRYEGCYISLEADGALTILCQPPPELSGHDVINTLCSLADLQ